MADKKRKKVMRKRRISEKTKNIMQLNGRQQQKIIRKTQERERKTEAEDKKILKN